MTTSAPSDAGAPGDEHPPPAPVSSTATRVRRRRRPSGEPPPLPRQLHASGKSWLLLIWRRWRHRSSPPSRCSRLTGTGAEKAAEEMSRAIGFVSRDQLGDQVRRYSGGLLQLDP